jgi:hypothetical protein
MDDVKNFPTMIIPNGTDITVNEQGQLSIRTPGNLVIQNSGTYSVIESGSGSVRIDPEVKVEAVSVEAADSCFVAGELTAWRVRARKITLEKGAQANIMLQESDALELDRNARLVGNFASEKELYLMLGRFNQQLRELPTALTPGPSDRRPRTLQGSTSSRTAPPPLSAVSDDEPFASTDDEDTTPEARRRRDEVLSLVRVIVERELGRPKLSDVTRQSLERLLEMVRTADLAGLAESARYLLSQIEKPSEDLERAGAMLDGLTAR